MQIHRNQDLATYKDQTDIFFASPLLYLEQNFPRNVNTTFPPSQLPSSPPGVAVEVEDGSTGPWKHEWPQNLVMFGVLLKDGGVKRLLQDLGYKEVWKAGWDWEGEGKRRGGVRVWRNSE